MNKNQIIEGWCSDYTYDGLGVVKYDTFTVFVKDMIIGEKAQIILTLVKKDFAYGKILKLLESSLERLESSCSIARPCGGCQLHHMSADEQARFKQNIVQQAIRRIGKLDLPVESILRCEKPMGYRNKVMLPIQENKEGRCVIGFYRYNSHDIIPIQHCCLQSERANRLIQRIREDIDCFHLVKQLRHLMLRDMEKTGQMMLVFVTWSEAFDYREMLEDLLAFESGIHSVIQNINGEDTNVVLGNREKLLYGSENIQDELCGLKFNISSHSFYQVNTYQTEVLYNRAIELAGIGQEDTVLDLYCGVGTIGLIASRKCRKVIGVEIVQEAVEDGKTNAKLNQIENVELICQDAKVAAKTMAEAGQRFDCVFVDPPRKGCSPEALETLLRFNSRRIVYISCNPSTLARDLNYLANYYHVEKIQPVDMFPYTYHCETIALLIRKQGDYFS